VIRGGFDVAGKASIDSNRGRVARVPSIAILVSVGKDELTIRRSRGGGGRFQRWCPPCRVPADAILRLASRRDRILGYPAGEGPPLREVTR
jgi:hypothetical protein